MNDQFDANTFNDKLDDFDDWFDTIHEPKVDYIFEAIKVVAEDEDDESPIEGKKSTTRSRGTMKVKNSKSFDKLINGKSIMNSDLRKKAIVARERAMKAKTEKQKVSDRSRDRRRQTLQSINSILGCIDEMVVDKTALPSKSSKRVNNKKQDPLGSSTHSSRRTAVRNAIKGDMDTSSHSKRSASRQAATDERGSSSPHSRTRPTTRRHLHDELGSSQHSRRSASSAVRRGRNESTAKQVSPKRASMKIHSSPTEDGTFVVELDQATLTEMLASVGLDGSSICTDKSERSKNTKQSEQSKTSRRSHTRRRSQQPAKSRNRVATNMSLPPKTPSPRKTSRNVIDSSTRRRLSPTPPVVGQQAADGFTVLSEVSPKPRRRVESTEGSLAVARKRASLKAGPL